MKFRKHISKLLALGILTNIIYFSSSADTAIPNRYETLEGEHITIDDSTEGELVEIEVFGNTVQDENNLEDIQSVGDLYVDENGNPILDSQGREQYKIDIVSQNKNLFNEINKHEYDEIRNDYGWGVVQYVSLKDGVFNVRQEEPGNNLQLNVNFAHPTNINGDIGPIGEKILSKGDEYTFSYNSRFSYESNSFQHGIINLRLLDKDGQYISSARLDLTNNDERKSIVIKNISRDVYYVLFHLEYGGSWALDFTIWDMMFASSDSNIEYVEPTSYTTSILLPTQLQKVGDIADRLYWDDEKGRYVIEKNIAESYIDSYLELDFNNKVAHFNHSFSNLKPKSNKPMFLEKFGLFRINTGSIWENVYYNPLLGNGRTVLRPSLNNPSFEFSEEFLNTLLPSRLYYELESTQLIETNITSKIRIPTYDGKTYVFIDSENGINPTLKVTVDRLPQIAKNAVVESETNPTSTNISLARMYTNMLSESLHKDRLQEQLNQLFNSDLTIEKKAVSVNADVYIKMKNTLSLSLDTNSIVFDDFDATEGVEMQNAVNLTVSSSLPYRVNAYLEDELYNADKSKKLDKSILNIKSNKDLEYRGFVDIGTPIILLDDQEGGTDTIHGIDIRLNSSDTHKADVYKTTLKFEVEQK